MGVPFKLTENIDIVNPIVNLDRKFGPYASVEDACIGVPVEFRKVGRPVGIIDDNGAVVDYYWKYNITDAGLVPKQTGGEGTTYESSGTIEFTETTANVKDDSLGLEKLKEIEEASFLGRRSVGSGAVEELSRADAKAILGIPTIESNISNLQTNKADSIDVYTKAQVTAFDDAVKTVLLGGVGAEGNTMNKLYNLILGSSGQVTKANITERNAYNAPLGGQVFVLDDGDGKWALYKATTAGVGATYVKLSDPDLLNAAMTGAMIKASYQVEPNAFNDALKITYDNAVSAINSVVTQLSTYLVDNLTSSNTDKALTANQGKVLDDKITAINLALGNKQATLTDTNFGTFTNSVANKNTQADTDVLAYVDVTTGTWVKQTFSKLLDYLKVTFVTKKAIITNATVSGTYNIDASLTDTYNLTLTGNTTLALINTSSTYAQPMTVYITGLFSLTYPAGVTLIGEYLGNRKNQLVIEKIGSVIFITVNNYV